MTLPKKIRIIKEIPGVYSPKVGDVVSVPLPEGMTANCLAGLASLLLVHGYAEDAEKRWRPFEGEKYWWFSSKGTINSKPWWGNEKDLKRYEIGNMFDTQKEATTYRDKIKKLLTERT